MPGNGLSRRELLALTAKLGVAGSVGAAAIWRGRNWLRSREGAPVVVIGSGAAGIAASLALLEQGVPVVMMEAGSWDTSERWSDERGVSLIRRMAVPLVPTSPGGRQAESMEGTLPAFQSQRISTATSRRVFAGRFATKRSLPTTPASSGFWVWWGRPRGKRTSRMESSWGPFGRGCSKRISPVNWRSGGSCLRRVDTRSIRKRWSVRGTVRSH